MKRKIAAMTMLAMALFGWSPAFSDDKPKHEHGPTARGPQTIQGEVLDMACYMGHEGQGAKHKKCAQECLKGGNPAGLLTKDGSVYLLVEDHGAKAAYQTARGLAAEQVKVTGDVHSRGGVQAIVVKAVEKAK